MTSHNLSIVDHRYPSILFYDLSNGMDIRSPLRNTMDLDSWGGSVAKVSGQKFRTEKLSADGVQEIPNRRKTCFVNVFA